MRISPSSSPPLPKSSSRTSPSRSSPSSYQTSLALRTVLGTSTANPNGFATYPPARQFAFCAGSTAVLAEIDAELNVSQRFFRARTSVPGASSSSPHGHTATTHVALAGAHNRPRAHSASSRTTPLRNGSFGAADGAGGGGAASNARERVKSVTSVALSPNGRWIAAGETGYSPRVLIFSTAPAPDSACNDASPLAILNEHSFGVKSIAFSPDSQYLATLGDINDGFLHVWALTPTSNSKSGHPALNAKLHSTNKCTSVVRGMCFVGNNVVTVGIRHIKSWRVEASSPTRSKFNADAATAASPSPLTGRNCVLGAFGDSTFTCVASVSENEAVVCTESGAICLYDDKNGHQKLQFVQNVRFGILSVAYDALKGSVWVAGKAQNTETFSLEKLRETASSASAASKPSSPAPSEGSSRPTSSSHDKPATAITCIALFHDAVITIDSTHSLRISSPADAQSDNTPQSTTVTTTSPTTPSATRDAVMGISPLRTPNPFAADFFTWSAGGLVNFWDFSGRKHASQCVALSSPAHADDDANELKVVRTTTGTGTTRGTQFFVAGDKFGVLSLLVVGEKEGAWECVCSVRAHSAEITDIAISEDEEEEGGGAGGCLIASCGRDRVVQLFKKEAGKGELTLVQTLEEHVGSVNRVLFKNDGEKLLSCSSDRTIVIRERAIRQTAAGATQIAYFSSKVITMKSSPVSMQPSPCDPDGLVVSSTDRYIHHYQVSSGRSLHSFRASDPETGDAVVMSSISIACETPGQNPTLLVGVCSTDKSLRVYDFDRGTLLSGEFGHTEGVTDVILLEDRADAKNVKKTLVSTGMDGIVMIWDLGFARQSASRAASPVRVVGAGDGTATPKKEVVVRQPLRRVISRSEMSAFQRADGQPPMPTTPASITSSTVNGRDTSPAGRTVRPKNSRTSLKSTSHPIPSRTNTSNTLSTPTHTPTHHRLSAASAYAHNHNRFDRSPSPSRRRPHTAVGDTAASAARRSSMSANVRTNSSSSSTTRLTDSTTPRRTTTRRMSLSTSTSASASASTPATSSTSTSNSNASASATDLSNINVSTEQMCRTLKAYRKKLSAAGAAPVGRDELEAELKMTLKAIEERGKVEKEKGGKHERGHGHLHFSKRLSSITRKGKHGYGHGHGSDESRR